MDNLGWAKLSLMRCTKAVSPPADHAGSAFTVPSAPSFRVAALPAIVMAEVYSWKDANGKVHYGSKPPAVPPSATARRRCLLDRLVAQLFHLRRLFPPP
jgi:hypothetical protein